MAVKMIAGWNAWVDALQAKYGETYLLRPGVESVLVFVKGIKVAAYSYNIGKGWVE